MVINMENVSLIKDNAVILNQIHWQVKPGEHWAILGLNGSGKTTLLSILTGYLYPSRGKVSVLGKEFGAYDLRELRKEIGWISSSLQEKLYVRESAREIVLSGKYATIGLYDTPQAEDEARCQQLLDEFSLREFAHRPYQTLSQGEKQRVLIARALMADPSLLIFDEPCTGLDILARENLLQHIQQLAARDQHRTMIYVTHRTEEILPLFRHTLLLEKGQIHASGLAEEILTPEILHNFFKTPVLLEKRNKRYYLSLP